MKKKIIACLISFILIFSAFSLDAFAADEPNLVYLDISKGTITIAAGTIFAYSPDGTIIRTFDSTATYVVTGASDSTNIIVNGGAVTLMLDNCNIDLSGIDDACALILKNNSNLSLGVMSDSTIKSGKNCAGIQVTTNATLNIIEPAAGTGGTLNVYGGDKAPAIGANKDKHSGNININYGTVNLYGGSNSSALGRSNGNSISNSISISGENTNVNAEGKLTAVETASLTVSSGATLNCQSSADNHAIAADNTTVRNATVNATAPGKGAAIYGTRIMINNSTLNAESAGGTAIGKRGSTYSKTYTTFINSAVTVKSPDSAYVFDGYSVTITNSEIFLLGGTLKSKPTEAFVYIDKVCTYTPTKPLTIEYTVPDGHTLIVPEGTVIEVGEGGKLHEGNGTLIIEGKLYYPGTVDGTENGDPILDNFALIEDGNITWFSSVSTALSKIGTSTADSITLKCFASIDSLGNQLPEKEFTLDLNSYKISGITVSENQNLIIINNHTTTSSIGGYKLYNYGTLTIQGNINVDCDIYNSGGILTLINTKTFNYHSYPFFNTNGGIINLNGAYVRGDSGGGRNDENCIINITNGGSIGSDYTGITNYGTINADNFSLYSYGTSIINNGGKVTLKNGKFNSYGPAIKSSNGDVYVENCTISVKESGSGINSSGTLYLKDSTISSSQFGLTGVGHSGTLTVENCTISGGYDGLCLYEGTAKITNSSIGGGFYSYNGYGLSNGGEMAVENCSIRGGYGVGNSGTIHLKETTINDLQWSSESYAVTNSGDFYFENGLINGSIAAYRDNGGTAEIKSSTIKGFDFTWNYDPMDLYGNEATFYMTDGTVKLFDCTLPNGFYVVTPEGNEKQYAVKDLIADNHTLYKANDDSIVELDEVTAMLDGEYYIKANEKLPDFGASIAEINENNVTSDNLEVINAELALVNEYNAEDYREEIATKITQTKEKCNNLLAIINTVKEKYENIVDSANKINVSKTKTDATSEIEAIIAEADFLLGSNNLTADERVEIEAAKAQLEKIVTDLSERKSAIETALEKSEKIANGKPTTADEAEINKLIDEIEALLTLELTDEQQTALKSAKDIALTVLKKFEEERNKLAELKIEFNNIKRERVNIFDKKYLENLSERIVLLISEGTLGTADLEEAQSLESEVQNLIELVQMPLFYGIIRIFWTFVSIIKAIIL